MSEFCFILDDRNGDRWYLDEEGPQKETVELTHGLAQDGFHQTEERRIGSCVLHVYKRDLQATDIVHG